MERPVRLPFLTVVASLLAAGCVASPAGTLEDAAAAFERCADPYPCGDEWPVDLQVPFDVAVIALPLAGHDGIPIESFAYLPALPDGVRAPVLLMSTPYPGTCASNSANCAPRGNDPSFTTRIDAELIASRGYAVVISNVRGTGNSGGCFEMGGLNEQLDQVALIEQLAAAEFSNGRVGMIGHSYPSFTAWMAAVMAPPALKTIVVSGHMTDLYLSYHTPQGAASLMGGEFQASYSASLGFIPPLGSRDPQHAILDHLGVAPERACPEALTALTETQRGGLMDDRNAEFWETRRLSDSFANVTAATFIVTGFEDASMLFHAFQDDEVWASLTAPKRGIYGHWGHALPPPPESTESSPYGPDWHEDALLPWLDFWLKGVGDAAPGEGSVVYEHAPAEWTTTTSWPPAEAREEVLYFGDGILSPDAGVDITMRPAPSAGAPACGPGSRVLLTEPQEEPFTVAGNAFAYLRLTSDMPGGIVAFDLFDVGPEGFGCDDALAGSGGTWLAGGALDLRFLEDGYQGRDFPTGTPTMVRVDIPNQAWTFEPGHQLALAISSDGWQLRIPTRWTPTITLGADAGAEASHLVLPLVNGTLGGAGPTLEYPPKPRS